MWLELQPTERGSGVEFEDRIVGGSFLSNTFLPSKRTKGGSSKGVLAGYPSIDFKAVLTTLYHEVDSSKWPLK